MQFIALVLLLIMPISSVHANQSSDCVELPAYMIELGALMSEGFGELAEDHEWLEAFQRSLRKVEVADLGPSVLREEELESILQYLAVPADVLLDYPEDRVPRLAADLHATSLEYWITVPAMLRVIASEGSSADNIFKDRLLEIEKQNVLAHDELADSCPAQFSEFHAASRSFKDYLLMPSSFDRTQGIAFHFMSIAELDFVAFPHIQERSGQPDYSGLVITNSPIVDSRATPVPGVHNESLRSHTGVTVGDPGAPVTMHIFSDFQCHFCLQFHDETLPQIVEDFVRSGQVKLVFHDFPRLGTDPSIADPNNLELELRDPSNESSLAAHAAMCASEQDKYLEMSDKLFANYGGVQQGAYNRSSIDEYAEDLGLAMDSFDTCMDSARYVPALAGSVAQGQRYGIVAVPMFILDNGNGDVNVIQQTAEGYDLIKKQIQLSIDTAP